MLICLNKNHEIMDIIDYDDDALDEYEEIGYITCSE